MMILSPIQISKSIETNMKTCLAFSQSNVQLNVGKQNKKEEEEDVDEKKNGLSGIITVDNKPVNRKFISM